MLTIFEMLFLFFLLISSSLAYLDGNWPELNKPPPGEDAFTSLVDLSKVANAPINSGIFSQDCNPDYSNQYCYWPCSGCTRENDVSECPNAGGKFIKKIIIDK